jgi:dienelactone hydrolase
MTDYDPFARGIHPVGVKSDRWRDETRAGRTLPVEIYYPATPDHAGQDLDPATQDSFTLPGSMGGSAPKRQSAVRSAAEADGDWPVVIFAHGYSGDRRETSFLCTHIASHGYRVISADHIGSTFPDIAEMMAKPGFDRRSNTRQMAADRFGDIPFMLDSAEKLFGIRIESAGITGASLGGWTSLIAPAADARIRATAPLCPAGGDGPLAMNATGHLGDYITFDWKSPAAVFMMLGDRDTWLPLFGTLQLLDRCPVADKRAAVLVGADHNHFVDDMEVCHGWYRQFTLDLAASDSSPTAPPWAAMAEFIVPFDQLMPEAEAQAIQNGLVTAHMDAHVKGLPAAAAMDDKAVSAALKARGLHAYVIRV